jgi:hypothetical protein
VGGGQLAEDAERDAARNLYGRLLACMPRNAAERFILHPVLRPVPGPLGSIRQP